MPRYATLLRGVNLGSRNRVAMPALRETLAAAGFDDVQTYLQSGNVVLTSRAGAQAVRRRVEAALAELGVEVAVIVRTSAQLAAVVRKNPLGTVMTDPKRYQVTFLSATLPAKAVRELEEAAVPSEQFVVAGREVYAVHPEGIARSKLWAALAGKSLGVDATSRNWTTVEALFELAGRKIGR